MNKAKKIQLNLIYFLIPVFLFFSALSNSVMAQEIIYPAPLGVKPSPDFGVHIEGRPAFVYASPIPASYCSFDMNGPVEIKIKANRDIKWVDIRPRSASIHPVFRDSTITFKINKPVQLSIELNGSIKNPLFIFANAVENNRPDKNDKNVIFFGAGKIYYPGIINIKSNQTLYIEGGAIVVGVIKADSAQNIRIAGHGILDGTYNSMFNDSLIKSANQESINSNKTSGSYHRFIELNNCKNATIEGITLHNSTSWQVVPIKCQNIKINNIKIVSDSPSDDGIDVVNSKNIIITNCFIRTKDDCIAIKSYLLHPRGPDVDRVHVNKCTFWNALWGNGLEIGFELNSSEVRNITFNDCDIIHVEAGAVFSIHNAGRATVKNVLYDNIRIEDARQKLFDLAIFRSTYSEDGTSNAQEREKLYLNGAWDGVLSYPSSEKNYHAGFRGKIRNIEFKNIKIVDGLFPFSVFYGFDKTHDIENILIENLRVRNQKITSLTEAKVYMENTEKIIVR